ncbi:MAG: hypothetical protein QGG17_02880 [Rhodospirillales bacterium]|jgi:hypothetical protein|nr:hypothetical protein [Rhodospirillales bacterium]MDP6804027.1 hypothetical protein [Rhodospirillales bacterium]
MRKTIATAAALAAILLIGAAGTAFAGGACGGYGLHVDVPTLDQSVADGSKVVVIKPKSGS